MSTQQWLIIGQGDIGLPVTNILAQDSKPPQKAFFVTGLARRDRSHYALHDNADFIQADALLLDAASLKKFTRIAVIITPDEHSLNGYQNSYLAICQHLAHLSDELPALERLIFISSTGVYGQNNGEWIDEHTTPLLPDRDASKVILQAEQALQQGFGKKSIIIRPSGIYGHRRLMRINKAGATDKPAVVDMQWSNRIMDSDLVTIIVNVLSIKTPKSMYIATDYLPVTTFELDTWLSAQLGSTAPIIDSQKTAVTGKRLHSNIPLTWLTYPDWQTGYRTILQQQAAS